MVLGSFASISGVSSSEELSGINKIALEKGKGRNIVIGYQVSNKSINQGTRNARQPLFAELGELDKRTRGYGLFTAVHYYTKDPETTLPDLEKVVASGVRSHGAFVQFNTLPLPVETLRKVRDMGFQVIFKVAVSNKQSPAGGYAVWKGEGVNAELIRKYIQNQGRKGEQLKLFDFV